MTHPTQPSGHSTPVPNPQIGISSDPALQQPGVNNYINSGKDVMSMSPTLIIPLVTNGDKPFNYRLFQKVINKTHPNTNEDKPFHSLLFQ